MLPRVQKLDLVRVALDELRQDGNLVVAHGLRLREGFSSRTLPSSYSACEYETPQPERQAAIFLPDDDDEEVAPADLLKTDVERPLGPGAEELHRVVTLLDAKNGVEDRLALLLEVVEGAAEEHSERRGHRVSLRPIERG